MSPNRDPTARFDAAGSRPVLAAGPILLLVGAVLPDMRLPVAVLIVAGWAVLLAARRPEVITWAAVLPLAAVLPWPQLVGSDVPLGEAGCVNPVSAIAVRRVLLAAFGLAVVAGLARIHRSGREELGLRPPNRLEALLGIAGLLVLVVGGLFLGPMIARPFFGELDFPVPIAALVPAVFFGIANGVLEEVLYRGALQGWLARVTPIGWAIAYQGLIFGIVHAGPEVVALLPVHIALLATVGIAGGIVRWRLGSLWVPIGIHIGADIALYIGLACRASG